MALALAIVLAIVSASLSATFLLGLLLPHRFIAMARRFMAIFGIGGAVTARLLLAVLLWLCAAVSLTPGAFRILALLMIAAAFTALMLGTHRAVRLIDRMADGPSVFTRLACAAGLAFSTFMLWSILPAIGGF